MGTFRKDDGIVNIVPPGGEAGKHREHYLQIVTMYNKKQGRQVVPTNKNYQKKKSVTLTKNYKCTRSNKGDKWIPLRKITGKNFENIAYKLYQCISHKLNGANRFPHYQLQ